MKIVIKLLSHAVITSARLKGRRNLPNLVLEIVYWISMVVLVGLILYGEWHKDGKGK